MHNLFFSAGTGEAAGASLVAVPYDFDYSGFVNAEYALAREDLGLENVRSEGSYRFMQE
ncbi:MAG: hypothetical protein R2744_05525 [Bacteroidales bacterium]